MESEQHSAGTPAEPDTHLRKAVLPDSTLNFSEVLACSFLKVCRSAMILMRSIFSLSASGFSLS